MGSRVLDPELLTQLGMGPIRQRRRPAPRPSRPGGRREAEPKLADSFRVITAPVKFRLPWPPTSNHYWVRTKFGGMAIGKAGREFRRDVVAEWSRQVGPCTFHGRLAIEIRCTMPDARDRNIDNLLKATLDSLAHAGAYRNDFQVKAITIEEGVISAPGWIDVVLGPQPGVGHQKRLFSVEW